MYICFECWHAIMNFDQAIFFPSVVEIFSTYFLTQDDCRDIFNRLFYPSIARVKNMLKMSRHSLCVKKYVEDVEKTQGKKLPG